MSFPESSSDPDSASLELSVCSGVSGAGSKWGLFGWDAMMFVLAVSSVEAASSASKLKPQRHFSSSQSDNTKVLVVLFTCFEVFAGMHVRFIRCWIEK